MGTNYYLYSRSLCSHCLQSKTIEKHIGKCSGGWCFYLHIYPEEGICNLDDWRTLWNQTSAYVKDEYGCIVPLKSLEEVITDRTWGDDFPQRMEIDGIHCIGHGPGTWDYIVGEFT